MARNHAKAVAALCLAAALLLCPALAEETEGSGAVYVENAYNFVDVSMDIAQGIPEDAQGVLGDIRESGVLRVATEPYFPPQEFIDPDLEGQARYVGSDMELARLIARHMGVELEIVPMDFSGVLDAVTAGECDLAISALSYTPGRAAQMTLSKGYNYAAGNAGSGLMIREEDAGTITGLESLAGRNIAAQSGSLQEAQMAENVFRYREFRRLSSVQELYAALAQGSVDAVMVDVEIGLNYIEGNPDAAFTLVPGVRLSLEEVYDGDRIAAKKGEGELIGFVNGVIDELLLSGEYRQWYEEFSRRAEALGM